ncbi:unnamed protein product [Adineta steineri]|uniref:LamG-like jellyroll fold domain-containing protein n=1 Tax=Adineta steineri TaxID=433720 RepID=A0A814V6V1_9BILA|nr:unnamed protein product [Adineta steineri]CAF1421247.1 unnamed protein product [Adineta steineri]
MNNSLFNITEEQCICEMVKLNGFVSAVNYFATNETCQLFSFDISSILIAFNLNSSFLFINQSTISITAISTNTRPPRLHQAQPPRQRPPLPPQHHQAQQPQRLQARLPQHLQPLPLRQPQARLRLPLLPRHRPPLPPQHHQARLLQHRPPLPLRHRQAQPPQHSVGCSASDAITHAPGGQGGESVLYTFDQTPNDYYGNYNAVPVNNPQYISPGYNGRGYAIRLLSNKSQYLTIANYMDFYNTSLTVEAWIYPLAVFISTTSYVDMIIYAQTNTTAQYQYMWMMLKNGKSYGTFFYDDISGSTTFQVNQWQHIAFTYDYATTTQVVYINGVVDGTNTLAPPCLITSGIQTIGSYPPIYNGGFFDGYIDQLEILFNRAKTSAEILDDATLVGYYSMDCLSYPSWDSGPNQITGVAVGLTSGDGGRVGQSYLFNTTSSYFQITGLVLLGQSYSPFSFAMWVRSILSVTSGGTILHVSSNADGTGWCIPFIGLNSQGQLLALGYDGRSTVQVTGPGLVVGQWVHIVETYSQLNGIRLYINGILYGQTNAFVYNASGVPMAATLGQSLKGTGCYHGGIQIGNYRGEIDEFYIYSRELSQTDITTLANP